ncbi:phosphonate C-P lyase system protein PhnH [Maritalea sp.]|uniref:phosphonate C-P lyase system protein PhnH n=1 Tax=Maritalea sp. TaxID=2003361 RepID=UPI003EFADCCA
MAAPLRNDEEIVANSAFDALLNATSRPGEKYPLPNQGEHSIIIALLDRECTVYATDAEVKAQIVEAGAQLVPIELADFVFCTASEVEKFIPHLRTGSDAYPDDGATLIIRASAQTGAKITLSGPGVPGKIQLMDWNIGRTAWRRRDEYVRYPMGFDMVVVCDNHVWAIPRSTEIKAE